ncbi:peroxisome biogenesis protein 16 isoform X2 [Jatropha curcas]|uniref:peroxisome biogenesis protein 16 isoform X2 n=1 Tax=Jatropha curcas TaxID=180498 RepID=UPI0005FAB097|nr:peroxisome biogenesis protein 16 isoform X2 [Jatropha curcas]
MEAYKRWVRSNKDYVHNLDSLANGVTWLLPERISDSEIASEAVSAILGIITAINEHIIDSTPTQINPSLVEPFCLPYSFCISAIKEFERLVEVTAEHYYGEDKKWDFIAFTEAMKVLVRLALFWNSGYKMLLHGGETPNIEKHSNLSSECNTGDFSKPRSHNNKLGHSEENPRNLEGQALSALSLFGENARMIPDPASFGGNQNQHDIMELPSPVTERTPLSTMLSEKGFHGGLFVVGEVLFITRPLIYVLFIRKYGIWSWTPWFLSLAMDFVGIGFLTQATKSRHSRKRQELNLTGSEKNELKRRKLLWALYLMRDPFFGKYIRQRLVSKEKLLEPVPVIGLLTVKILELVLGAQSCYTYMSGS